MRRALGIALVWTWLGCGPMASPPELLLLVTVDTLRADHLGAYGSRRGLTPALDALAQQSVVFDAAYAPASFTLPSVAAMQSGLYPEELGILSNESALPASTRTLAVALGESGWRTGAVVSNFVLREASGLARGFDVYDDELPAREQTRRWPERTAAGTTDAALATLDHCMDGSGAPCFLWVHYQDPHGPYTPPPDRRARFLEQEQERPDASRRLPVNESESGIGGLPGYQQIQGRRDVAFYRAGYAAEVVGVDLEIGRLLGELEARELAAGTVVAFAADHGEGLGEHDYWFAHGEMLTDPLVRVPLMLRVPGVSPRRRGEVVSLLDLYPTLLGVAGLFAEPLVRGRDLLADGAEAGQSMPYMATLHARKVPHYGLVEGDFKFLASLRNGIWDGTLYRRGREDADLSVAAPHVASAMRSRLRALRGEMNTPEEMPQELSREDREQLRALGYGVDEDGGGS